MLPSLSLAIDVGQTRPPSSSPKPAIVPMYSSSTVQMVTRTAPCDAWLEFDRLRTYSTLPDTTVMSYGLLKPRPVSARLPTVCEYLSGRGATETTMSPPGERRPSPRTGAASDAPTVGAGLALPVSPLPLRER